MTTLNQKILDDMKASMKEKDQLRLAVLRMLVASIKNRKIEKGNQEDLSDADITAVVKSEIKKRKDSSAAYRDGGREDLAGREDAEAEILSGYLPEQMSEEEVRQAVSGLISELDAKDPSDFGRVMGAAMPKIGSRTDGQAVSRIVKELLS